jgi:hypothetical protein
VTGDTKTSVEQLIERWRRASGSERGNYQLFVHELCSLLELPPPDPAREDIQANVRVTLRSDQHETPLLARTMPMLNTVAEVTFCLSIAADAQHAL